MKSELENALIKLGTTNPKLRQHIRPLFKAAGWGNSPKETMGRNIQEALESWRRGNFDVRESGDGWKFISEEMTVTVSVGTTVRVSFSLGGMIPMGSLSMPLIDAVIRSPYQWVQEFKNKIVEGL